MLELYFIIGAIFSVVIFISTILFRKEYIDIDAIPLYIGVCVLLGICWIVGVILLVLFLFGCFVNFCCENFKKSYLIKTKHFKRFDKNKTF